MITAYEKFLQDSNHELSLVEYTDPIKSLGTEKVDLFICLSGRGTFKGDFTVADRVKFHKQGIARNLSDIDTLDTCRRMEMTVNLLKAYHRNTGRVARIFFNGVKEQNDQLRQILASHGHYLGVPASLFIIDDIPMDNTMGQAISLRVFVEKNKHMFSLGKPKFVFVSSSYHIPRVLRSFGSDSPLMSPEFYLRNVSVLKGLSAEIQRYVLAETCLMRESEIYTYGVDREIMKNPGAEVDIRNDRDAVVNYSSKQNPPSISSVISRNVMQYRDAVVSMSIENAKFFENFIENNINKSLGMRIRF